MVGQDQPDDEWSYRQQMENLTVAVTKPDGTTETLGPFTADPAAYAYTSYTPDMVGTYTFVFNFPGQLVTSVGAIIPIPLTASANQAISRLHSRCNSSQ